MSKAVENYFRGDTLAASVWESKYKFGDEQTPEDMNKRIVDILANKLHERILKNAQTYTSSKYQSLSNYGSARLKHLLGGDVDNIKKHFSGLIGLDKIILGGSMLQGIGNKSLYSSLSNCFVLGRPFDSYSGINKKADEISQVMKRRGGAGLDLSSIRPDGSSVHNQSQTSSGPVLFAQNYSNKTLEVAQYGRRGALMLSLCIEHPDVLSFITAKQDLTKLTGANLSVILSDKFMTAVQSEDDTFMLKFPIDSPVNLYNCDKNVYKDKYNQLIKLDKDTYIKVIHAKEYWQTIIDCAWKTAEPGILFSGNWEAGGTDYMYEQYRPIGTNPCSEIPMQEYDACRLASVNMYSFINDPFTPEAALNISRVYKMFYEQLMICDLIIDLECEYIQNIIDKIKAGNDPSELKDSEINLWEKIMKTAQSGRRCGCGFTGLGDMLAAMNLPYYSPKIINDIFNIKLQAELDASIDLAVLYGSFEGYDAEIEINSKSDFIKRIQKDFNSQYERMLQVGRRNVSWSTAAPTGSLSILAQTTSGIEPLFKPFYKRRKKCITPDERVDYIDPADGQKFTEFFVLHPKFRLWIKDHSEYSSFSNTPETEFNEEELNIAFEKSPWYKSCADDLNWKQRVEIQSIVQKYTTHAISSTINLPADCKPETISNIYLQSWKSGLKGNTVYRDGCRGGVMVSSKKVESKVEDDFEETKAPMRPKILPAHYHTLRFKKKTYSVIIGLYKNKPYEIFILSGVDNLPEVLNDTEEHIDGEIIKDYKDWYNFVSETFTVKEISDIEGEEKMISLMLSTMMRHRTPMKFIIKTLEKTKPFAGSFTHKLIKILNHYMEGETGEKCPTCGGKLRYENGCVICQDCGWTKC